MLPGRKAYAGTTSNTCTYVQGVAHCILIVTYSGNYQDIHTRFYATSAPNEWFVNYSATGNGYMVRLGSGEYRRDDDQSYQRSYVTGYNDLTKDSSLAVQSAGCESIANPHDQGLLHGFCHRVCFGFDTSNKLYRDVC